MQENSHGSNKANTGMSLGLPEGWAALLQSSMDSDSQSMWLARKQDVFNPSCCWLHCCWFHQMLSNQELTLQHRSTKSHCASIIDQIISRKKKALRCILIFAGFLLWEDKWSCMQPPALSDLRAEQFRAGLRALWAVSCCLCRFL